MRRGASAAGLILAAMLACPVHADPGGGVSAPAALAAAAAAKAARQHADSPPTPDEPAAQINTEAAIVPTPPLEAPQIPAAAGPSDGDAAPAAPTQQAARSDDKATPVQPPTDAAKPDDDGAAGATDKPAPAEAPAAAAPVEKPKLVAAKTLFGAAKKPAPMSARAIGTYARGCLAGAKPLAVDGPTWQAMRLSRNRTWGHPDLIALLERFAGEVKDDGWPGLLVGDISQPRGGPMLTGHASHQLGLDADIWFTPMPDHKLSRKERETLSATSMLASDSLSVDPKIWTDSRVKIIKRVASYPKVERVLVHPAIKKALCQAAGTERAWLNKVRPYWGHFYHFHVRIGCPDGSPGCKAQAPVPGDDGCGKELDDWFQLLTRKPKPRPPGEPKIVKPVKPKPPMTLDDLPADCRDVLAKDSDITLPPPVVASTTGLGHGKSAKPAAVKQTPAKAAGEKTEKKSTIKPAVPTKAAAAKSSEKTKKQ